MQTTKAATSSNILISGLPSSQSSQQQTVQNAQYVTVSMNNQTLNIPSQGGQYIAVQPGGGISLIPVQTGNTTQLVQLQVPGIRQAAGGNFFQFQTASLNTQTQASSSNVINSNQAFIPVQQVLAGQNQVNGQHVSFQIVQQPGGLQKARSLVATKTVGNTTQNVPTNETRQQQMGVGSLNTSPMKTVTLSTTNSNTSTVFYALQQAVSTSQISTSTVNTNAQNIMTKTLSSVRLPQPNLGELPKPDIPAAVTSTTSPIRNIAGQSIVVSGENRRTFYFSKTQQNATVHSNPVFLPITMANNVSVLTNQTPALMASKRGGQTSIPIRIQKHVVSGLNQSSNSGTKQVATIATLNLASNQNQQQQFLIPIHSTDGSQQQQNQSSQLLFHPLQQKVVSFTPSLNSFAPPLNTLLQQKKEAKIAPGPPNLHKPITIIHPDHLRSENKPLKKPCNCTKSQCLKLYCECFANGEFCSNCNCRSCLNNIDHENERSKAIKSCLERNPYAFHPKIGKGKVKGDNERRHTKGCNCKRSGCLKNYCECYEAKILCSGLCRCVGCKNFEESDDRKTLMQLADAAEARVLQQNAVKTKLATEVEVIPSKAAQSVTEKLPLTFMNADVSKATCDILMATAMEAERENLSSEDAEKSLIIEFSRCLDQIIDKSKTDLAKNSILKLARVCLSNMKKGKR